MTSVIIHYQEIALKGRNRPWFVERLLHNLRVATSDLGVQHIHTLMGTFNDLRHREFLEGRAYVVTPRRAR